MNEEKFYRWDHYEIDTFAIWYENGEYSAMALICKRCGALVLSEYDYIHAQSHQEEEQ